MMIVVSYDVAVESDNGEKRLRHVAKICRKYGQRVQFSVFECIIDYSQYLSLKNALLNEIDPEQDSIRFYLIGNKYENHIEHYGVGKKLN